MPHRTPAPIGGLQGNFNFHSAFWTENGEREKKNLSLLFSLLYCFCKHIFLLRSGLIEFCLRFSCEKRSVTVFSLSHWLMFFPLCTAYNVKYKLKNVHVQKSLVKFNAAFSPLHFIVIFLSVSLSMYENRSVYHSRGYANNLLLFWWSFLLWSKQLTLQTLPMSEQQINMYMTVRVCFFALAICLFVK